MRIAMIGSRGIPATSGGVEHVVEALTDELTARGHEVLVYARRWYLRGAPADRRPAGRVICTPGLSGKSTDTLTHTATAMLDVLRRKVDVVHVHSPGPAIWSFLPRLAGIPIVLTIHGPDWEGDRWSSAGRLVLRAGLAEGMRLAAGVSAVSLSLSRLLSDTYGRTVVHVPNGVRPPATTDPSVLARWGLSPDGYALNVGRIVPGKDVDLLIEAWSRLASPMPLVVVGDAQGEPAYLDRSRRLATAAGGRVKLIGPQYGRTLAALLAHAAVVVQPSRREGFSLVLLEAAAHGRCVVAREIPSNREILGEWMVGFEGDSPSVLAERMLECIVDGDLRRSMGGSARRRVLERFSWSAAADGYEDLYRWAVR